MRRTMLRNIKNLKYGCAQFRTLSASDISKLDFEIIGSTFWSGFEALDSQGYLWGRAQKIENGK